MKLKKLLKILQEIEKDVGDLNVMIQSPNDLKYYDLTRAAYDEIFFVSDDLNESLGSETIVRLQAITEIK